MKHRLRTINEDIALAIDFSQAPNECEYCGKSAELRPYGKDGAWICFKCGMEHEEETDANFADILDGNGSDAVKIVAANEAMEPKQTRLVKAKDLKVGDYLPFTKSTVVVAPSAGLNTPAGKVELTVESNGKRFSKTWSKNTEISVANVATS